MKTRLIVQLAVVALGLGACSSGPSGGTIQAAPKHPGAVVAARAAASTAKATTPPVSDVLPRVKDFALTVRIVEKKCFGSAGCVITYRISPSYLGATPLSPARTITVVYEILGGQEPQIGRFTVTGDQASLSEETIETKKSTDVLTARVTDVF